MVPRVVAWSLLGFVLVLLGVAVWLTPPKSASATSTQTKDSEPSEIGRYQVVRQSQEQIILLDTTCGKLYSAGPKDIQPYASLSKDDKDDDDDAKPPADED